MILSEKSNVRIRLSVLCVFNEERAMWFEIIRGHFLEEVELELSHEVVQDVKELCR